MNKTQFHNKDNIWLVYDGLCPVCNGVVNVFMVQKTIGKLNLIDARSKKKHLIINEIKDLGLDIDQGMVLKFQDRFYHGADALHIMALISTRSGIFNKINYFLFRSKILSKICYPILRSGRNFILWYKGIDKINQSLKYLNDKK